MDARPDHCGGYLRRCCRAAGQRRKHRHRRQDRYLLCHRQQPARFRQPGAGSERFQRLLGQCRRHEPHQGRDAGHRAVGRVFVVRATARLQGRAASHARRICATAGQSARVHAAVQRGNSLHRAQGRPDGVHPPDQGQGVVDGRREKRHLPDGAEHLQQAVPGAAQCRPAVHQHHRHRRGRRHPPPPLGADVTE